MSDSEVSNIFNAIKCLPNDSLAGHLRQRIVQLLPVEKISSAFDDEDRILAVEARPELAYFSAFWPSGDVRVAKLLRSLKGKVSISLEVALVTLENIGPHTLREILSDQVLVRVEDLVELLENKKSQSIALQWIFLHQTSFIP